MSLNFIGSEKFSLGVEIELQIIDPNTLDLTPQSREVLRCSSAEDVHRIKVEVHQSMLEIDTEVADSVSQCRAFLQARAHRLQETVERLHLKLAIAGTHPFQLWADRLISENDRYERLHRKYQWLVQRMNVYGLHVHVGVQSGELALAISYALAPYLPHLLALSANSPFWQGKDTGMQSCRCSIMESLPYSGPPPLFQSWAEFEKYYEALHTVGAISSIKDLYWYIRPNLEYGTLEFRICDAISTLDETMAVVALIQCLVCSASEDIKTNPTKSSYNREFQWIIPENQWNAARYGLKAIVAMPDGRKENIADGILQLIKRLTPTAEKLDCLEDLMHIQHMVEQGNNAEKQRRLFQTTQSLQALVSSSISDFEKIANSGMKK